MANKRLLGTTLAADIVGCLGERVNDGLPDDRFWDVASLWRIDAK